jgi:hypothetical protein
MAGIYTHIILHVKPADQLWTDEVRVHLTIEIFPETGGSVEGEYEIAIPIVGAPGEISVESMKWKGKRPKIELLDSTGEPVDRELSAFPPEAFSKKRKGTEEVVFALREEAAESRRFEAAGYVETPDGLYRVYGPKKVKFARGERQVTVNFPSKSIRPPEEIRKTEEVLWQMEEAPDSITHETVPKTLYALAGKPCGAMKRPRRDVLDIACEIAEGLAGDDEIRTALEHGLFERWCAEGRSYDDTPYYESVTNVFDLTAFLAATNVECSDSSTMHMLACNALGVKQQCMRLQENDSGNTLTVKPAARIVGPAGPQEWDPGTLGWPGGGWHQVSCAGKGRKARVYDPLLQFDSGGEWGFANGTPRNDYAALFLEKTKWKGFTLWVVK